MPEDGPSFAELVERHYRGLQRFAVSLTRHEATAQDLVQQTFLIWAQKGHRLVDKSKAKTWLFTTLYREFLRGRRRDRYTDLPEDDRWPEEEPALAPAELRLDGAAALAALQQVDEVFRAPLTLFYLDELSYQEIADTLGVPIGTVMSRLARGKARLKQVLEGTSPRPIPPGGRK